MEAVLRYAGDKVAAQTPGQSFPISAPMKSCRGFQGIKTSEIVIGGKNYRVGVVHGIAQARRLLNELMRVGSVKFNYHLIEVMACPGGCIGGGGQPHSLLPNILSLRSRALYSIDRDSKVRRSGLLIITSSLNPKPRPKSGFGANLF